MHIVLLGSTFRDTNHERGVTSRDKISMKKHLGVYVISYQLLLEIVLSTVKLSELPQCCNGIYVYTSSHIYNKNEPYIS